MRSLLLMLGLLILVAGCGGEGKKTPVPLSEVPEKVMKAAQDRLPDVNFDRAQKKTNGDYEILGKNKQGKTMEVEVTPKGEVVAVE